VCIHDTSVVYADLVIVCMTGVSGMRRYIKSRAKSPDIVSGSR